MTERDGAWMARIIARFSPADIRTIASAGRFSDPGDVDYLTQVMVERQHRILARYLTRLSPLADVRTSPDRICAVDLARLREVFPPEQFHYTVVERAAGERIPLAAQAAPDGGVCWRPAPLAAPPGPDSALGRRVIFEVSNGTAAGPLEVHSYDLGARGLRIVGLIRPGP
jgi:hypothetical protein